MKPAPVVAVVAPRFGESQPGIKRPASKPARAQPMATQGGAAIARSSTSRGAPDRATRSSKYAISEGAARMAVPEKGKVSSCTALGVATHFEAVFGFELCRFIKLLAIVTAIVSRHRLRPGRRSVLKNFRRRALVVEVFSLLIAEKRRVRHTERSPTPKAPPKANVTNPDLDSPTLSWVPARSPCALSGRVGPNRTVV